MSVQIETTPSSEHDDNWQFFDSVPSYSNLAEFEILADDRSVAKSVGSGGGTVTTENGEVTMTIPAGALDDDTNITVVGMGEGFTLQSDVGEVEAVFGVELGPEGTQFDEPVTLVFAWDDADNDGIVDGFDLFENELIITKDGVAITEQCQFDAGCDPAANTFTFSVTSFSEFTVSGPLDTDDDGVADDFAGVVDLCPDTVIPEAAPTSIHGLGKNRWTLDNPDGTFTQGPPQAGSKFSLTTRDTQGCSCEQIVDLAGLGEGHLKYGCSTSVMLNWIDNL